MDEDRETDGAEADRERSEENVAEIKANSLSRMTDRHFEGLFDNWFESAIEDDVPEELERLFKLPAGLRFTGACAEVLNNLDGDQDVFSHILAMSFNLGWKAREALAESEILERMAR